MMSRSIRRRILWFSIFFLVISVLGIGILSLIALSPKVRFWVKSHLQPIVRSSPFLEDTKKEILSLKHESSGSIPFRKELTNFNYHPDIPKGFVGNRAEQSQGILSWISPFSDRIPPTEKPEQNNIHPAGQARPIVLTGLQGETLSFQMVLRSQKPADQLGLSLSADNSSGVSCITTHRFLEIYMHLMIHTQSKYGPIKELINPDPLVPFNDPYTPNHPLIHSISLKPDFDQPVWMDVHFSRNCKPGIYHGTLTVFSGDKILRKTPVSYEVLNARLPRHSFLNRYIEFYVSRFYHGENIHNDEEFQQLYQRYFKVGYEYGFSTNDAGDIKPNINWDWKTGTPTSVDWSYYDHLYGPMLSGSLTGSAPNIWSLPIATYSLGIGWWGGFAVLQKNPSKIEDWKGVPDIATQNLAKLLVQHWKEKGWPIDKSFVYLVDEPNHKLIYYPDTYKLIAASARSLHQGSRKIRVMITDAPYIWLKMQKGHDKRIMRDNIDIWAAHGETYIPDRMAKRQKHGQQVWFYQAGPPYLGQNDLSSTGIGMRMWFWTAWKYHVNGVFYWASTFWNDNTPKINPYTNGGNDDGVIFYPGHQLHFLGYPDIDGPVPSIRAAQWRRGYEDYKYLTLLKQDGLLDKADSYANSLVHKALDDGGYIPYWRNPLWWKPGNWVHDPRVWHRTRIEIARILANQKQ